MPWKTTTVNKLCGGTVIAVAQEDTGTPDVRRYALIDAESLSVITTASDKPAFQKAVQDVHNAYEDAVKEAQQDARNVLDQMDDIAE